jgi:peptidoglycan/LPS O-acetylase OafA/YrhL
MSDLKPSLPPAAEPLQNPQGEGRRFHELDAMRGLAALLVVLSHFKDMFYHGTIVTGWRKVVSYPFNAGHESVMFFFLLSGFVLSLPYLRGNPQTYSVFIRKRILRIYGPYLGALLISLACCSIWHGQFKEYGWWASRTWALPVSVKTVVNHLLFIGNYDYGMYNTAFWSLVYEMRISIIFPLLFLLTRKLRTSGSILFIIACTVAGARLLESKTWVTVEYVGVFAIGILMAKHLKMLSAAYLHLPLTGKTAYAVALFLIYEVAHRSSSLGDIPIVIFAAGGIVLCMNSRSVGSFLRTRYAVFLGRISYSLYLVHGTVLFAMAAMLKDKVSPPVFFLLFVPTAILLSWGFYVAVESPFMVMSRNVGRRPRS